PYRGFESHSLRQTQARGPATAAIQEKFRQGHALHQQGRLAEAERCYSEVLAQEPTHYNALHLLGVIALQTGRAQRGIGLIIKAIGLNSKDPAAHSNLAMGFNELKRSAEALASCDNALALAPNNAETYNNRGNALGDLQRLEEALASYQKAIALKPAYVDAY